MFFDKIKEGEIVRLKSGGPEMTVVNKPFIGMLTCGFYQPHPLNENVVQYVEITIRSKAVDVIK
jgi:uncharacterized protein YodC (DUF2158 family)